MIAESKETGWQKLGDGCENREISGFYSSGKEAYKITQCIIYQGRIGWDECWYAKNMFGGHFSSLTFGKMFNSKEDARLAQDMVSQAYCMMWSCLANQEEEEAHGRQTCEEPAVREVCPLGVS